MLTVANLITLFRISLVPAFVVLFMWITNQLIPNQRYNLKGWRKNPQSKVIFKTSPLKKHDFLKRQEIRRRKNRF